MKITRDKLDLLRAAIVPLDTAGRRDRYRNARFERATATRDVDRRYRWDLLWLVIPAVGWPVLEDLKDEHIDTALRAIVPTLGDSRG